MIRSRSAKGRIHSGSKREDCSGATPQDHSDTKLQRHESIAVNSRRKPLWSTRLSLLGPLVLALFSLAGASCLSPEPVSFDPANDEAQEIWLQGNRNLRISSYREANSVLRDIYRKRPENTLYCNCSFDPDRKLAGDENCSFSPRDPNDRDRQYKVHWEHVVPASRLGGDRPCWSDGCQRSSGVLYGGRSCCRKLDPIFRAMEADLHNLRPAIGEINRHRQNYNFGDIPGERREYGACDMEISSETDLAEPPESARGIIARSYLYMNAVYGIRLSDSEKDRYLGWHRKYPPGPAEFARDRMIRKLQGNSNPFLYGYGAAPEDGKKASDRTDGSGSGWPMDYTSTTNSPAHFNPDRKGANNPNSRSCLLQ